MPASRGSDNFDKGLRDKLQRMNSDSANRVGRLYSALSAQVSIDQHSTADEVADWPRKKFFWSCKFRRQLCESLQVDRSGGFGRMLEIL